MRASKLLERFTGISVSLVLACVPLVTHAAPPAPLAIGGGQHAPAADDDAGDDVLERAKDLFDAGVARYTAADYEAAIDFWLEAYALVPPTYDNRLIKAELIYNVARAQQKWFEIDKDVKHLRQSREILARYLDEIGEIFPAEQVAIERERIKEHIDQIDEQIAAWEAEQARREAELAERMRPKFDEDADAREEQRNKAMIGAGAGLTALGAGGVGLFVTGLFLAGGAQRNAGDFALEADIPERERLVRRGQAGNALIITGAVVGGAFLAAGLPLLGVGFKAEHKRKQRRLDAGLDARLERIGPLWVHGGAGLTVGGRF
jgi:tetratricopeptide (TPR) repeat protein